MNTITVSSKQSLSLFLITIFLLSTQDTSVATDTINTSRIFTDNGGETVISAGGSFELGFFSPEDSKNRYVGIWYKNVTLRTVVWVANRENPLTGTSGTLRVVDPGLLVLLNHTNGVIWSTNASRTARKPVARLLDSGNLVVEDDDDGDWGSFIWQSFDYPTDTQLPGMKLGRNFVTGLEVYLSSWRSISDPSIGEFTYHCDPSGFPQNIMKRGSAIVYRSGPWNGIGTSGVPNLRNNTIFTYGLVMNKNEVYYHYELVDKSVISRFTLSETGVGQRSIWVDRTQSWVTYLTVPIDNCDNYKACGPYGSCNVENTPICGCLKKFKPKDVQGWDRGDWSNGCVRRTDLNCLEGDAFLKYSGVKLPDTRNSWYNEGMSLEQCKLSCLKNCSCMAYANQDISRGGSGCLLWFRDLLDIKELSPGEDIYVRIASSELDSKGGKRVILIVTLSMVIGVVVLSLSLSLVLYSKKRKKLDHKPLEIGRPRLDYMENNTDKNGSKDLELPQFDLSTLYKATDNFSFNNKLGEGGFGPVYKGLLEDGQEVAVKRLSRTSLQGVDEFKNEVNSIAKLQHRNLVKLLGCCIQGEENMLVYEYMINKSLDLLLFEEKSVLLDWPRRFSIINGIARGLMYLHQDSRLRVIHRDLKASNVLLDSDMNPKISDFGLARTFGGNVTGAKTSRVVGTYGYMSPEYAVDGLFSVKSDVFSYGVLVLEIVSGKRNRGFSHTDHNLNLLGHAWMLYKEEKSSDFVDSYIGDSRYSPEVLRSIHVGLLCVQEHRDDRPSMSSVVMMLSNEGVVLPPAKRPGFFTSRDVLKIETSESSNAAMSPNEMTITLLEAR